MTNIFEREASVLGPGIVQGAEKAAQETWANIKTGAREFEAHPLSATGSYLKDHALDFGSGAAISLLAPKGIASKLILAWSLRGVGMSTAEAMSKAASPSADLDAIRGDFAERLGREGAAVASSLPMMMAGASFGRMGTNALLGEGRSLFDVARGRVTTADIGRNANSLMESAFGSKTKVLITDLDDTVFPLKDYLVPSLQKNVAMLSQRMSMPESEVIKALGPQRIHPWILEQSDLARRFKGTPEQFTEQIVKPFWQHDAQAMRELRPFDGVVQTLKEARERGIKVVALTNAPKPWAINRLKAAGLDGYIDHLYAMETPEPKLGDVLSPHALEHGRTLLRSAEDTPHRIGQIHALPQGFQKPDVHGIRTILDDLGVPARRALAIGDNWNGDGAAPQHYGVPFIWAKYGRDFNPEYKAFLRRFKPRTDDTLPVEPAVLQKAHPDTIHIADSYTDLLRFLNRPAVPRLAWHQLLTGRT